MKETRMNPDGDMEEVVWVDIKGYKGIYAVNQFGDVKSYARYIHAEDGKTYFRKEYIRQISVIKHARHHRAKIDGSSIHARRLVAEAFLGLDITKSDHFVINIYGDDLDDYYKHLEIVDRSTFRSGMSLKICLRKPPQIRPIYCITLSGEKIIFDSIKTAINYFGITNHLINKLLNTDIRDSFGNLWYDVNDSDSKKLNLEKSPTRATNEQIISAHESGLSLLQISIQLKTSSRRINRLLKRTREIANKEELRKR